jgi:uncharacterized pyridoxamine 5'-phosphate oxidase family protein
MNEVIAFLNANRTVFLATSDQGAPRVRPFQFQFERDGRLWFCTAKSKAVYAQLAADPRLQLACTAPNMATLRITGQANLDDSLDIKRRVLDGNAPVRSIYGSADNPDFTSFSIDHGSASISDLSGNPPKTYTF